jgi:hypothetical protein
MPFPGIRLKWYEFALRKPCSLQTAVAAIITLRQSIKPLIAGQLFTALPSIVGPAIVLAEACANAATNARAAKGVGRGQYLIHPRGRTDT